MDKYSVFPLNGLPYDYLIISNTYENPINFFLSQADAVGSLSGKVLFDLTLIYGFKHNRYVGAEIKNNKLDIASIKPVDTLDSKIKAISQKHFANNSFLVENSILPNALKYHILHHDS